jgi:hypothetical protein
MKIKVSEASGPVLDWMVAEAKGIEVIYHDDGITRCVMRKGDRGQYAGRFAPTTDWSQGGPLLSEEGISRTTDHSGLWIAYWTDGYTKGDEGKRWMQCHRSELVAGLRCFVASKLGETVEVPEELT